MKAARVLTVLSVLLLFIFRSFPVVILLHGTFASDKAWCKPGGEFYEALALQASSLGHNLVPFTWSGKVGHKARERAARSLAKLIESYPEEEEIIIVAHSHGGNVSNIASNLLVSLEEETEKSSQKPLTGGVIEFLSSVIEEYTTTRELTEKYRIDNLYLLATPVLDKGQYVPCMKNIKRVYNLFSLGDSVQPVLGLYKRKYKEKERIINMRVKMEGKGVLGSDDPKHREMHDPIIAKQLLLFPQYFDELKAGDYSLFIGKEGELVLESDHLPIK